MKEITFCLSDEAAKLLQEGLENVASGIGALKLAAQGGTTYEEYVEHYKSAAEEEAREKTEGLIEKIANFKEKNITMADVFSADFRACTRLVVELADHEKIKFFSNELSLLCGISEEEIQKRDKIFSKKFLELISLFLDFRAEKILETAQNQKRKGGETN